MGLADKTFVLIYNWTGVPDEITVNELLIKE